MLRSKMRRKLNKRRPEAIAQREEACDKIIRWALAVFEAAKVAYDLGKLGTKPKPLRCRIRPFFHFRGAVYAVVRRIELDGAKVSAVRLWELPARRLFGVG